MLLDSKGEILDVHTGQVRISGGDVVLRTTAIGSCLVVSAFSELSCIGAMAHIMLPGKSPEHEAEPNKYAQNAIDFMFKGLSDAGADTNELIVCLVGAGNVLRKSDDRVCQENIMSVMQILRCREIAINAAILGGIMRKGIFLNVSNGSVYYTQGDSGQMLLWHRLSDSDD